MYQRRARESEREQRIGEAVVGSVVCGRVKMGRLIRFLEREREQ